MAAETEQAETQDLPLETIRLALEETWERVSALFQQVGPVLNDGPDAGGWTPRQLLSHLVGALQRVPVHAGFYLAGQAEIPILLHRDYWIDEWAHAPLESFAYALLTAYEGNRAFLRDLAPASLALRAQTPFGETTLGELLLTSYRGHIGNFHGPQLEAFLKRSS